MGTSPSKLGKNNDKNSSFHENLTVKTKGKVEENFDVGEELYRGNKASVRMVRKSGINPKEKRSSKKRTPQASFMKTESKPYALKFHAGVSLDKKSLDIMDEAKILRKLDHPNIVKLFATTKIKVKNNINSLVLELCDGGNLTTRYPYAEDRVSSILRQLLSAVAYIHKSNIIHRDINVTNILFESKKDDSEIKLVDFGCATEVPVRDGKPQYLSEKTGNIYVMAPEVIKGRYSTRADMWSVGVVTYMLIQEGKRPFDGKNLDEIEKRILSTVTTYTHWKASKKSIDFVEHLLITSPYRSDATEALNHAFIQRAAPPKPDKDSKETNKPQPKKHEYISNELIASLQLYQRCSPLKRMALNVLARKANLEKIGRYRKLFRDLDLDFSSTLSKEEFSAGFNHAGTGFSDEELDDLFSKLDINCNGEIMITEFLAATIETSPITEEDLIDAFQLLDEDASGIISKKNILKILGTQISDEIKAEVDIMAEQNPHGVTFEQFKGLFGIIDRDIMDITEMTLGEQQSEDSTNQKLGAIADEDEEEED